MRFCFSSDVWCYLSKSGTYLDNLNYLRLRTGREGWHSAGERHIIEPFSAERCLILFTHMLHIRKYDVDDSYAQLSQDRFDVFAFCAWYCLMGV